MTDTQRLDTFGGDGRWVVEVTLATDRRVPPATLDRLADAGDTYDMTVAARANGPGLVFTVEVDAGDVYAVHGRVGKLARTVGDLRDLRLVELVARTPQEHERQALRSDTPELMSAVDVADLLGVSRQRVHQLHDRHVEFPAPYVRLGSGPVWTRPAIQAFAAGWLRKPGRPAKAS